MADQNDPNSNSDYRGLPIDGIISAPLTASARANSQMAIEQTKFLMEFCFAKEDEENYKPVMINLQYSRSFISPDPVKDDEVTHNKQFSTTIQVPLLTIVPLNSLAVNSVKLDFDLEITHQRTKSRSATNNPLSKRDQGEVHLFGHIGSKQKRTKAGRKSERNRPSQSEDNSKSHLFVEIMAGPSPLPLGLTSLINAYNKAITPSIKPSKDSQPDKGDITQ